MKHKKFNRSEAEAGAPVMLEDGTKARILCFDLDGDYPIAAAVNVFNNDTVVQKEFVYEFNNEGYCANRNFRLVMAPVKREGWINVYKERYGTLQTGIVFETKEEAISKSRHNESYITTTKIEWQE